MAAAAVGVGVGESESEQGSGATPIATPEATPTRRTTREHSVLRWGRGSSPSAARAWLASPSAGASDRVTEYHRREFSEADDDEGKGGGVREWCANLTRAARALLAAVLFQVACLAAYAVYVGRLAYFAMDSPEPTPWLFYHSACLGFVALFQVTVTFDALLTENTAELNLALGISLGVIAIVAYVFINSALGIGSTFVRTNLSTSIGTNPIVSLSLVLALMLMTAVVIAVCGFKTWRNFGWRVFKLFRHEHEDAQAVHRAAAGARADEARRDGDGVRDRAVVADDVPPGAGAPPRHPVRDLRRRLRPRPRPRVARRPPRAPAARRVPRPARAPPARRPPRPRRRSALQRAVRPPDQRGVPEERRRLRVEHTATAYDNCLACGREPDAPYRLLCALPGCGPASVEAGELEPGVYEIQVYDPRYGDVWETPVYAWVSLSVVVRLLGLYSLARLARRFGSGLKGFQQSVRDADFKTQLPPIMQQNDHVVRSLSSMPAAPTSASPPARCASAASLPDAFARRPPRPSTRTSSRSAARA